MISRKIFSKLGPRRTCPGADIRGGANVIRSSGDVRTCVVDTTRGGMACASRFPSVHNHARPSTISPSTSLSLSRLASQPAVTFPPARPHAHGSCRTNKRSRSCKRSRRIGAKPLLLTDFRDRNSELKSADQRPVPRCKKFVSGCADNVSEMTYFVSSGT